MRTTFRPGGLQNRIALILGVLVVAAFLVAPPSERAARGDIGSPRAPVTVTLTYDDGTADQQVAADLMAKYDMKGTFYLNSSRLDQAGRLTTAQARQLQTDGNEIGGHTVTHADLPTLDPDEQARQICNDRVTLLQAGLRAASFAYPYGDDSADTQQAVAKCGYNSARVVGDILSPGSCHGCPVAEKIVPKNAYAIRTPDSIKPATTVEQMQNFVLQAESGGGGWVVLVMHRICDGCDEYAANPARLDAFFSWLAERGPDGTVVRTVGEVMGGTLKPAVNGPPPAPRAETRELLNNPSMETDTSGDGIPNCWQRGGYGNNTAAWSKAPVAHTGSVAQQVAISAYTDGDRRMISPQDLGACAPGVVPGHTYKVSGWYRTSGTNGRLVAYYRDAQSHWIYLSQGPVLAPNPNDWKQAVWTTPAMPAGATAMSTGFSMRSAGTTMADDVSVMDTDQTPPGAQLISPVDGSRVRGTARFNAIASDASGIEKVEFLVDGLVACTVTAAPYRCDYDTTAKPDTVIAVSVRATDTAGNTFVGEGRNYTVSNSVDPDSIRPTVSLTVPDVDAVVGQDVTVQAVAADNDAVIRVLFFAGNEFIGSADKAPYAMTWNSRTAPEGRVRLRAAALDLSGNLGVSAPVDVTVANDQYDKTAPASVVTCNGGGCAAPWYKDMVKVAMTATDGGSGVAKIVYTTNGTDPTPTNGTVYGAPLDVATTTTLKYRAYDRAGNAEPVGTAVLNVDRVAPTAKIANPAPNATISGTIAVKSDVADANGIARVYFYLDGKQLGTRIVTPYQWMLNVTAVAAGQHTLQVMAQDPAGNQTRSETITVTVA